MVLDDDTTVVEDVFFLVWLILIMERTEGGALSMLFGHEYDFVREGEGDDEDVVVGRRGGEFSFGLQPLRRTLFGEVVVDVLP